MISKVLFAGFYEYNQNRVSYIIGIHDFRTNLWGTLLGSLWISSIASILFLAIAGCALIMSLMYNSARKQITNSLVMIGVLGLFAGFVTDLMISLGIAQ